MPSISTSPATAALHRLSRGRPGVWPGAVLANALLAEYVPFIVLLFALYVIAGGVRIEGDLIATPTVNAAFLGIGALASSFIGTTGAAMLLVRPLLETNRERHRVAHTVVFFIFLVCNCGGCLLPIGDPPLFLGYLEGVDFFGRYRSGGSGSSPTDACFLFTGSGILFLNTRVKKPAIYCWIDSRLAACRSAVFGPMRS